MSRSGRFLRLTAVLLMAGWPLAPGLRAAEPTEAPAVDPHPDLVRLSPGDEVWVDRERAAVIVGGRIVLTQGPIEFFACPRRTKEHESIVAVNAPARLVHAGLLAIGLTPGSPVSFDPEYRAATGPKVAVMLRWQDASGKPREARAQDWIRDTRNDRVMSDDWVFAGSTFWKDPSDGIEYYQADGGDLICVSNFPTATLDLPVPSSQSNEALLFEAFADRVPPRDTRVEIVLSALPERPKH